MLHTITAALRTFLSESSESLQCRAGRAADRESALLWLLHNTGSSWAVCVTVSDCHAAGEEMDRRWGRAEVGIKLYIGLTPGAPEDADRRAEDLHLAWGYVWSCMARVRWGSIGECDPPVAGRKCFTPRDGFLDGNKPMLPGAAAFSRVVLKITGADAKAQEAQELLLATQEWTTAVSLPVTAPEDDHAGDDYFLFN